MSASNPNGAGPKPRSTSVENSMSRANICCTPRFVEFTDINTAGPVFVNPTEVVGVVGSAFSGGVFGVIIQTTNGGFSVQGDPASVVAALTA